MFWKRKKYRSKPDFLKHPSEVRLSFCITHKNRIGFLKETLPQNLKDNRSTEVEFVVVNFDEDNALNDWIKKNFKKELEEEYLKLFHCAGLPEWHAPKAKNTAHALASGDLLVNLDCDNFTGIGGGSYVIQQFLKARKEIVLWQFSGIRFDGTYGRIALTSASFKELGGYNEDFLPMGYQDGDLIERATKIGLKLVQDTREDYTKAIKHDKFAPKDTSWEEMNFHNIELSRANIENKVFTANGGNYRGLSEHSTRVLP